MCVSCHASGGMESVEEVFEEFRNVAAPILRDLETLERSILEGLKALSLTPQAAASLGKTLSETRKRRYDWTRLTPTEKQKVDALIGKAEVPDE